MAELRENRDLIGGIVLVFFLLFSLVPAGIMPVATPGGIKVVICTNHGPLEITQSRSPQNRSRRRATLAAGPWRMACSILPMPHGPCRLEAAPS